MSTVNTAENDDGDRDIPRVEESSINWDELFTADVISLRRGSREGHLGQWEYSDPEHEEDPVRGTQLWVEFLQANVAYYMPNAEILLARRAAPELPKIIPQPIALAFLGVGNKWPFKRKDLRLTTEFTNVVSATVFDISRDYAHTGQMLVERYRPNLNMAGSYVADIFGGFPIPRSPAVKATNLATMFGGTLYNVDAERDISTGSLIMPERAIRERLKAIRRSVGKGGWFVTTHDTNRDPEKVEAAYKGQGEFACNLAHRIHRDTPYKNIVIEDTEFRVGFDEESGILAHYLTLNFGDNGGPKEYLINISPKPSTAQFDEWCRKEKFEPQFDMLEDGVRLVALEGI